jgi:DNA topoisomerase IA
MLRRSQVRPIKLLIVESPNKVSHVTGYARAVNDLTFGNSKLAFVTPSTGQTQSNEIVHVMATVGHFMEIKDILIEQKTPSPKPTAGADAATPDATGVYAFEVTWEAKRQDKVEEISSFVSTNAETLSEVIIATDPDREGEIIGEHALNTAQRAWAKLAKRKGAAVKLPKELPYSRAYIQSITAEGVASALEQRTARTYDYKLASAAMCRSALDKQFGFFGSAMVQAISEKLKSVGRVQTPALILIHQREEAHDEFLRTRATTYGLTARASIGGAPESACTVTIVTHAPSDATDGAAAAATPKKRGRQPKKGVAEEAAADAADGTWSPTTLDDAKALASKLVSATSDSAATLKWTAALVSAKPVSRSTDPPQPLTLQALMLRMGRKFRMGSEDVMRICQQLFTDGLITYPRTDSVRVEPGPAAAIKKYVAGRFGEAAVASDEVITDRLSGEKVKGKKKKSEPSNVEDAHEALRPTNIANDSPASLAHDARAVYDEIRNVAMAAFMVPHVQETLSCVFSAPLPSDLSSSSSDAEKRTKGEASPLPPAGSVIQCRVSATRTVVAGFTAALGGSDSATAANEGEGEATDSSASSLFDTLRTCATQARDPSVRLASFKAVERKAAPPPLFFEGALIEELKQRGIGRPSTYASILATLKARQYVTVDGATGKLRTTEQGRDLVSMAKRFFPLLVDLGFTARMESSLDAIVRGRETPNDILSNVQHLLVTAPPIVARASYFATPEEREKNPAKAAAVEERVKPFVVQQPGSGKTTLQEYCNKVRWYLRSNVKR